MSLPTLYEHYTTNGISAGLSADQPHFTLNNQNITLYSGAFHYFRVPQEYWRDRLRKLRAAGLNAVETYVPWNLHEPEPGVYDFGNGGTDFQELLDIEKFLKIAQEEDLFAIVRPGPYICAEWEFGGMPSWLLRDKGIKVRSSDERFMGHVARYFNMLLPILAMLQFTKGGPIIAFQIENEYSSLFRKDTIYMDGLKNMFIDNGLVELFVTSDGPKYGTSGQIPGVLYTANFNENPEWELDRVATYQKNKPFMVMEYWTGWFDHWTEQHHTVTNEKFTDILTRILDYPSSVNFYMFIGGTSFGFMNGANLITILNDNHGYQPDISSYDYDAPLTENGNYTDKYFSLKKVIGERNQVKTKLPNLPEMIPTIAYEKIKITHEIPFNALLEQADYKFDSENVISMEMLPIKENVGQTHGYIVYRKENLNIPSNSILQIQGRVCDALMVLINGELKSKILSSEKDLNEFGYWRESNAKLALGSEAYENATLELIVENWGRSNFGLYLEQFEQYKGLWQGDVLINNEPLRNWQIIPLQFKKSWINNLEGWRLKSNGIGPTLYKGILNIKEPMDTFIDMRMWRKGFVAINGFVVSRHCRLGPQQTVYLPGPFLHEGDNDIVIFEHFEAPDFITFNNNIIFDNL